MRVPVVRSIGLALTFLMLATLAFGRTLDRAIRIEPLAGGPKPVGDSVLANRHAERADRMFSQNPVTSDSPAVDDLVRMTVDNDPFRDERSPSPNRYRMPGERVERVARRSTPRPPVDPPEFRVVGTARVGETGYAVIAGEDDVHRVIALGESVDGYRLTQVDAEAAALTMAGELFVLRVPEPEPHPATERVTRSGVRINGSALVCDNGNPCTFQLFGRGGR